MQALCCDIHLSGLDFLSIRGIHMSAITYAGDTLAVMYEVMLLPLGEVRLLSCLRVSCD